MTVPRLTLLVIAKNEEKDLPRCLDSVRGLADEIVLVDDSSADGTREAARSHGARIFQNPFQGFTAQKQFGLQQARGEWVLNLDADESLSPGLRQEMEKVLRDSSPPYRGYSIPFHVHFMGRRLRFGGVGNERHLRLFLRAGSSYGRSCVHEGIAVSGPVGSLNFPIRHTPYRNFEEYLGKMNRYTTYAAQDRLRMGRRFRLWHHGTLPLQFLKRYLFQLGFLDGPAGWSWAALAAYYHWMKYLKLRDLQETGPHR
ncbi:MAG: glycosyltransferase family 2 protein [Elusimicrobia bacterium]|nr:glycosyltransferase family 2 protein [Elusimicrobiota bacterium]